MARKRLTTQILLALAFIMAVMLAAFILHSTRSLRHVYYEDISSNLFARANLVGVHFEDAFASGGAGDIQSITRRLGMISRTRITVIAVDGSVLGESERDQTDMENHMDRSEIIGAIAGKPTGSMRYSRSLNRNMMYAAVPVFNGDSVKAVVRAAMALTDIDEAVSAVQTRVIIGGVLIILLSFGLVYLYMRKLTGPIADLRRGAEAFARGDLSHRLPIGHSDEVGALADAMTTMARELDARIRTILEQRNEQEAVLSSMVEGVLAVDREERVITINDAARRFFDVIAREVKGKSIQEIVRHKAIQDFAAQALVSEQPSEGFITLQDADERVLQAHGTLLRNASGAGMGAVIVVNDITRLRKLEAIRKDFVANVSHELKTPVTSIKGFVETLMDGAAEDPSSLERFLGIIAKEADRLHSIIEDLLSLSRIEQDSERNGIAIEAGPIAGILETSAQSCRRLAKEKSISLEVDCEPGIMALRNAHLLEQAVGNLIDNAIKYSGEGTVVSVRAWAEGEEAHIRVADRGCGIPPEHLPRIFERFYRADKSRSRKTGSSGLGLAIVKHIVQAHGGRIAVESIPESGSIFTITLRGASGPAA